MPTVEDVARIALAAVGADISYRLVSGWVAERYGELATRVREMRHLRHAGQLTVPAPYTTGTLTATQGSRIVTGSGTTWTADHRNRWLRVRLTWYEIVEVVSTTSLLLATEYTEETASAATYRIVAKHIALPPEVRHFSTFTLPRRRNPLMLVPYQWLQMRYPERQSVGSGPEYVAEVGSGLNSVGQEVKIIELYPYSSRIETVDYLYWTAPLDLQPEDQLPLGIDAHVLKDGVLIDIMRYEMAKAAKAGNIEMAALWRNDYRAQRTVWEDRITQALRSDRGPDDARTELELPATESRLGYLPDAHSYVYDNWPR